MRFFAWYTRAQRGGAVVARKAHNLEVAGASPAPATSKTKAPPPGRFGFGQGSNLTQGEALRAFQVPHQYILLTYLPPWKLTWREMLRREGDAILSAGTIA